MQLEDGGFRLSRGSCRHRRMERDYYVLSGDEGASKSAEYASSAGGDDNTFPVTKQMNAATPAAENNKSVDRRRAGGPEKPVQLVRPAASNTDRDRMVDMLMLAGVTDINENASPSELAAQLHQAKKKNQAHLSDQGGVSKANLDVTEESL